MKRRAFICGGMAAILASRRAPAFCIAMRNGMVTRPSAPPTPPVQFISGIDNNAVKFNFSSGSGMYDNSAVIDTGVVPSVSTEIEYSAYLYPIGTRSSGYVTGVYFGSLAWDDAYDSFWVRAFVPDVEGTANLQARIGNDASDFFSFANSSLTHHTFKLSRDGFYADGVLEDSFPGASFTITPRYPIYLGGANLGGRPWRCYRQIITDVKITDGDNGVDMHFKPAIVGGVVGMVDVNNSNMFYDSATSIAFTEVA